jgi:hypothetical protein
MYGGRPNLATPAALLSVLLISSVALNMAMSAFARAMGLADVLQTMVFASGPLTQSGKAYTCARAAHVSARTTKKVASIGGEFAEERPRKEGAGPGLHLYRQKKGW